MTEEFIRQLIDFVAKYGDECTPQQVKLLHRVLNRLELRADDERKKHKAACLAHCCGVEFGLSRYEYHAAKWTRPPLVRAEVNRLLNSITDSAGRQGEKLSAAGSVGKTP